MKIKMTEHLLVNIIHQGMKKKDFNVMIDDKSCFDVPVKNKEKRYEKLLKWVKIMITQLVIYWTMIKNHYKLIAIHLSKKNLIGRPWF